MKVTRLGIDLAKSILRLHKVDARGAVVLRKQLTRKQLLPFLARLEPCTVGMEACGGAHYWAREITKLGHTARLMKLALRQAVSQEPEELRQRCRGYLRGGRPALDAVRAGQERISAGRPGAPSDSFPAD